MIVKKKNRKTLINNLNQIDMLQVSTPVILTDAQIKSLPSTFINVLPAPGAGKANIAVMTVLKWHTVAGYYGDDADTILGIGYNGQIQLADASVYTNMPTVAVDGLAVLPGQAYAYLTGSYAGYLANYYQALSNYENTPLQIGAMNTAGDFLGGHADNTLKVTVYYVEVTL